MAMKALVTAALLLASASPALAQKEIPKAEGHNECPLGYVNTLGTTCVSPIYYEVAPTHGKACLEGWMNEHRHGLLQEEEGSSRNPLINNLVRQYSFDHQLSPLSSS